MAQTITIGHVAKVTGVAAKTIRYYEEIGVLPAPTRTASGYRQYDEPGVRRVRFIRRARTLGLPLRSLGTLTATLNGGSRPALRPRLLALVRAQLSAVRDRIAELQLLQQELEQILRRPLAPARERLAKGCQCLEVEGTRSRHTRGRPPLTTAVERGG
jgi:MerR family transcriptional regulator, copper efflux regulator